MAQTDRRSAAAGEFIGKDVFLKSFQRSGGAISESQLTTLVASAQNLNLSVLKVGAVDDDTVKMIVEGADELASDAITGYVIADVAF